MHKKRPWNPCALCAFSRGIRNGKSRHMRRRSSLFSLSLAAMRLAADAQAVVSLRMIYAATGQASPLETRRMVNEKVAALFEAQNAIAAAFFLGRPRAAPSKVIAVYGKRVRANRRRLTR